MGVFEYHNASIKGDPRWQSASPWTAKAPIVVLVIFALSIIETVLGAVWIAQLQSDMTVPKIIQPLIFPGLAFFNAVPSLHLHCLTCRNPPILAMWFSGFFVIIWLGSSMTYLVACNLPTSSTSLELRRVECSTSAEGVRHGPKLAMWWVVVILELALLGLYACHGAMAWYVRKIETKKAADREAMGMVGVVTHTDEEAQKARERWRELVHYGEF